MKRMTKMEAVASLWEIKTDIDRRVKQTKEALMLQKGEVVMSNYYKEDLEKYERQSRALEMAGKAMTR